MSSSHFWIQSLGMTADTTLLARVNTRSENVSLLVNLKKNGSMETATSFAEGDVSSTNRRTPASLVDVARRYVAVVWYCGSLLAEKTPWKSSPTA